MASEIAAPKRDPDAKAKKKTILKHFLQEILKGKSLLPKLRNYYRNLGAGFTMSSCKRQ
jgi:hypothetical protein